MTRALVTLLTCLTLLAVAAPAASAARVEVAVTTGIASSVGAAAAGVATPDCTGAQDTRRGRKARRTPFRVCGIVVISKHHRVSARYHPALRAVSVPAYGMGTVRLQPTAARALKGLFRAARKAGYTLVVRAAHRSWATQAALHSPGDALVAPPGASEHQSGLAVDLAARRGSTVVRGTTFGTSTEGRWVRLHAAAHGFILRYPKGKRGITGIPYEPWHVRWIGVAAATDLKASGVATLERYLKVS